MSEKLTILAAADVAADLKKVKGVAYSGGSLSQYWSSVPVYVDLSGVTLRAQIPLMYNHYNDPENRLGAVEARIAGNQILIEGSIDPAAPKGNEIIQTGKNIPWQLSIGASIDEAQQLDDKEHAEVNGVKIEGPALIARKTTLNEVSVVAVGADPNTSLSISARLSTNPIPQKEDNKKMPDTNTNDEAIKAAAATAERNRIVSVNQIAKRFPEIAAKAVEEGWTEDATRKAVLDHIEASYKTTEPPAPHVTENMQNVLQAALMQSAGVSEPAIIKEVGEKAIEAADRRFHGSLGLQELIIMAANANGYEGRTMRLTKDNWYELTCQAMTPSIKAGASAVNLPGLLGGVINRRLLDGYESVDASYREIAEIVPVQDFRAFTSYRLTNKGGFKKVTENGELKHGELAENEYANQADTYGEMLTFTRKDIIDDNLGALQKVPFLLGQDAGIQVNDIFWSTWLADSNFFKSANGNLVSGNSLSINNFQAGITAFRKLTNEAGRRLGGVPSILLVPIELENIAEQIYKDSNVIAIGVGNSAKTIGQSNPYVGKYRPVICPYLSDTSISGYSETAWYLLADPRFRAAIQVAFLNGVQSPTVQSAEAEFNRLGINYRAYLDFGVAFQDPKAGVKISGV